MVCRFKYCKHNTQEIKENEPFDKVGRCYYHSDCNQTRIQMNNIATRFMECINDKVSISELKAIVKKLCIDEGYGAEYVSFALEYAILHPECKLTYPAGMYRMCRNLNVVREWDKKQVKEAKMTFDVTDDNKESTFTFKSNGKKGFQDILCK